MRTGKRAEVNTQSWGDRGLHWLRWPAPPTPPWMARIQETLSQRCELQAVGPRQGRNLSRGHALHPPPAARRRARQVGPLWGPRGASGGPQGGGGPTSLKMITTLRCSLGACVPVCGGGVGVRVWGNVCPVRARRATFLLTIPTSAPDLPSHGEAPQVDHVALHTFPTKHVA